MLDEEVGQYCEHILGFEPARYLDRQALAAELVDDHQHLQDPPIPGPVLNEVVSPDVTLVGRPPIETTAKSTHSRNGQVKLALHIDDLWC